MVRKFDFLVIGSGLAGMSFALKVAHKGTVALICKAGLEEANTYFAQGGIASVTNLAVDNFEKHIEDTMIAGDWISDREAVEKVVRNAPEQIKELIKWGVNFDKKEDGEFDLHKEGGHSEFRILHHKDNTGAEIQTSLIEAVKQHPNITVLTDHYAVEIITQHHQGIIVTRHTPGIKCYGAYVLNEATGEVDTFLSKVTIMATGGCEAVYRHTTNPLVATGDGIAMVYRAKGAVKDMEFIQFHPTALFHPGDRPSFLITEAMRGYGGVLRTKDGKEFMQKYDPRLSLAPRDIVARAIDNEMKQRGEDHVYLDVTHKDPEETKKHFPNIYKKCLSIGIDITKEYIPVDPATRLPVYSLYRKDSQHMTPEMLDLVDTVIYDIQDIGARFYTYISTLLYVMRDCAAAGKELVVLDRINPLGGKVEGGLLQPGFESFVGAYPLTTRYGLTPGEFARLANEEQHIGCQLHVLPVLGWKREMLFPETGLYWMMPSPAIPNFETALLYPGTCLTEATNISEGRGTSAPFELIGAPFINGAALADRMNAKKLPGVIFTAAYFTPSASKHAGRRCEGVHIHLTDTKAYDTIRTGTALLYAIREIYPNDFALRQPEDEKALLPINRLTGSDVLAHDWPDFDALMERWENEAKAFDERAAFARMYE